MYDDTLDHKCLPDVSELLYAHSYLYLSVEGPVGSWWFCIIRYIMALLKPDDGA